MRRTPGDDLFEFPRLAGTLAFLRAALPASYATIGFCAREPSRYASPDLAVTCDFFDILGVQPAMGRVLPLPMKSPVLRR